MSSDFVRIVKIGMAIQDLSQKQLAFKLGLSEAELCRKMNGERAWTNPEITKLLEVLGLVILPEKKLSGILIKALREGDE